MKRKRYENNNNCPNKSRRHQNQVSNEVLNNNGANEILKLALERVCALQHELARETDDEQVDPETAGFAACAIETFRFLASEGLTADHPIIQRLSEHLLGGDATNSSNSSNNPS